MKSKSNQPDAEAGADNSADVAANAVLHEEPQVGGSYVRDLTSGELKQVAGPALTEQPVQE